MADYMRGEELVSFWDGWLSENHMQFLSREQLLRAEYVIRTIERLELDRPAILDIGCAHGWVSRELLRFGGPVTGVDISETGIAAAKEEIPDGEFHAGDFVDMDFPDESFDVVICLESIAYMDQPRFVAKVAQSLRAGGHFIVTTPNWPRWEQQGKGRASPSTVQAKHHSMESLTELLGSEFEIVQTTTLCQMGVTHVFDSRKVNKLANLVIPKPRLVDLKGPVGKLGRGGTLFVHGRKQ